MKAICVKADPFGWLTEGKTYECDELGNDIIIRDASYIISQEQFKEMFEPCYNETEMAIYRIASSYPYNLNEGEWGYMKFREGFYEGMKYANKQQKDKKL